MGYVVMNEAMCCICGWQGSSFAPRFRTGGRLCVCPSCRSLDRNRHLFKVIEQYDLLHEETCVLEIAPSISILRSLSSRTNYVGVDYSPSSDLVLSADLRELPFPDASFDMVLCSHVLEHVRDSQKCIAEISRVLKRNGRALIQVPYKRGATTEQLEHPDEHGHVWNYDRDDFVLRLAGEGLVVDAVNLQSTVAVAGQVVFDHLDVFVCSNPQAGNGSPSFTQYIKSINRLVYRRDDDVSKATNDISHAPLAT